MKILFVGDYHAADQNPVSRLDDFKRTALRKLSWIVDFYNERSDIDQIVFLGDIFHKKQPNKISHLLVNAINTSLDSLRTKPYLLLGNHDIPTQGRDLEYYPIASLHMQILYEPICLEGGWWLFPHGTGISEDTEAVRQRLIEFGQAHDLQKTIMLFHENVYISDEYFPLFGINLLSLVDLEVAYMIFGHIHKSYGPTRHQNTLIHNPGAVMRVSKAESDLALIPTISVLDCEQGIIERVVIPHERASDIMFLQEERSAFVNPVRRSSFVDALQGMMLQDITLKSVTAAISERRDVSDIVRDRALLLLKDKLD